MCHCRQLFSIFFNKIQSFAKVNTFKDIRNFLELDQNSDRSWNGAYDVKILVGTDWNGSTYFLNTLELDLVDLVPQVPKH